jgi:CRISPR system Cascade subunit CasC
MAKFIQLHLLTAYPPSNLNRDDLNRPKTAIFGGTERIRISSQSLKRAWRVSEVFAQTLKGLTATRTRSIEEYVLRKLLDGGVSEDKARADARAIFVLLRSGKKDKSNKEKKKKSKGGSGDEDGESSGNDDDKKAALMFLAAEEIGLVDQLCDQLIQGGALPDSSDFEVLKNNLKSPDIAMFGRMMADNPNFNVEAAVQVAHAFSVNSATVEDDYFAAVDDLNKALGLTGGGHLGESAFSSGVFYLYVCIDRDTLVRNLSGDEALASRAIEALVRASATVSPTGKQASFATRAYASFVLAEKGSAQPRSLASAFLRAVDDEDLLRDARERLVKTRDQFLSAYGRGDLTEFVVDVIDQNGPQERPAIERLIEFAAA